MALRRFMFAALAAVALTVAVVPITSASDEWCTFDPPIQIKTPGGHTVVVKVTDYAQGLQHIDALKAMTYTYVAVPGLAGGTDVTLAVTIPNDAYGSGFATRSVVATAADENSRQYAVYADNYGVAGAAIVHHFNLDLS